MIEIIKLGISLNIPVEQITTIYVYLSLMFCPPSLCGLRCESIANMFVRLQ